MAILWRSILLAATALFSSKIAAHFLDRNFLGVQRIPGKVCGISEHIQKLGLTRSRCCVSKANAPSNTCSSAACIFSGPIYGPWTRHHKRRMQQEFYTHPKPSPHAGGGLQFKTDHPKYYDLVLERAEEFSEVNPERNSPAFLGLRTKKNAAFSHQKRTSIDCGRKLKKIKMLRFAP